MKNKNNRLIDKIIKIEIIALNAIRDYLARKVC